jgi:hypothetical protein
MNLDRAFEYGDRREWQRRYLVANLPKSNDWDATWDRIAQRYNSSTPSYAWTKSAKNFVCPMCSDAVFNHHQDDYFDLYKYATLGEHCMCEGQHLLSRPEFQEFYTALYQRSARRKRFEQFAAVVIPLLILGGLYIAYAVWGWFGVLLVVLATVLLGTIGAVVMAMFS